ncbi:MAG: diguanylate cyclase [Mariprofundales bacterium]|nr:diguanylate cyclase [Mariprofundales bacterium]
MEITMNLRKKKNVFVVVSMVVMIVLFSVVSLMSFRYFSLNTVRSQSRMAAEMVRVALTEEMEKGLISERADLIARMNRVPGLADVHVVRGQPVIDQFGPGHESEKPTSPQEHEVLKSGRPAEDLSEIGKDIYKVTIPFIASRFNDINCMNCHDVPEGTVNGAVTLTFSLEHERNAALMAVLPVMLLMVFFGLVIAYYLKRLLDPMVETASEVKLVLGKAKEGDFSHRVEVRSNDEVGEIAENTNAFVEALENSIGAISKKVEAITVSRRGGQQQDLLTHTLHVVDDMVNAARFKQEIEEDLDLNEVYQRIRRILRDRFGLDRFCLYEIEQESGKMHQIYAEGMPDDRELWCDATILIDSDHCRAKRTAHSLCSCDTPNICAAYRPEREDDCHLCIPLMLSDRIGNVLQVIVSREQSAHIPELQSAIAAHMAVATPVIESKRLMQSLKESSLRDAMTGLYNRRFLEEFTTNLTASVARRKSTLGILMLDVDWFKKVNDEHGHDIGDHVLKSLSEIIVREVRESDIVVRYGGEEFIALLPDTTEEGMMQTAERIRASMAGSAVQTSHGPLKKTISIGCSVFPVDADGFWQCIKYSDVALYAAKDGGRNKVLRFIPEMWKDEGEEY